MSKFCKTCKQLVETKEEKRKRLAKDRKEMKALRLKDEREAAPYEAALRRLGQ